jgi:UDP-N-acetylmuramoyl-L-alanyl-D-glutamate--2,6-diaminopimelate ligase
MRLRELLKGWLDVPVRFKNLDIQGIACDSRAVRPGWLFVAVPGEKTDGHLYIHQAVQAGAVAIAGEVGPGRVLPALGGVPFLRVRSARWALARLAAAFCGHPSRELHVAGITGTKGKTTTCWLLDSILRSAGKVGGLFGTVENRIGSRSFAATSTTPGSLELQGWLRELVETCGTHAVIEVSSHAIHQQRIEGIEFRAGIFTNITPEHLDYHKSFENYLRTKTAFFEALPSSAFAVLPREEKASQFLAARTRARIVWYGSELEDGVERLRMPAEGLSFTWKGMPVQIRLWGYHNLMNALAAMSAAECLGIDRRTISLGIGEAKPPPGRLEEVPCRAPFRVLVDYAHTDGALDAVLKALRPVTPGRLITIFGCGGDRDRLKRPRMGRVAELGSDQVIITSDNPRSEPPQQILSEIATGLERPNDAVLVEDRREAIGLGIRMAREGDTILIAGKGHETYQEFQDHVVQFDDREVARAFLQEAVGTAGN